MDNIDIGYKLAQLEEQLAQFRERDQSRAIDAVRQYAKGWLKWLGVGSFASVVALVIGLVTWVTATTNSRLDDFLGEQTTEVDDKIQEIVSAVVRREASKVQDAFKAVDEARKTAQDRLLAEATTAAVEARLNAAEVLRTWADISGLSPDKQEALRQSLEKIEPGLEKLSELQYAIGAVNQLAEQADELADRVVILENRTIKSGSVPLEVADDEKQTGNERVASHLLPLDRAKAWEVFAAIQSFSLSARATDHVEYAFRLESCLAPEGPTVALRGIDDDAVQLTISWIAWEVNKTSLKKCSDAAN